MRLETSLLLVIPALCHGFVFRDQKNWNGLKVTWGLNPFSSFQSVPRTQAEADKGGEFTRMQAGIACDGNANFVGTRYWKSGDTSVILIYDANGYIAGMQAGFPKSYQPNMNNYPATQLQNMPFVLDANNYYVTAYFVDPATVCTGRTAAEFQSEGTGTGLWIQNGSNPVTDSVKMPATQTEADKSKWTKGACFISMGHHYWYNLRQDMDCNEFFPVFLLYNEGVLNAFGWAFGIDLTFSPRLEHPPQSSYGNFMTSPPTCLSNWGTLTTLHIYLTNSATQDLC